MHHHLCKNCEHTFEGNFCSNCGQKTNTKRLDWNYIFDELKYTFLHLNGGLLYTCKQLLVRPGDMVREFIEGKRVKHYKPILLVFVLAGITTLLLHYSGDMEILAQLKPQKNNPFNPKVYADILSKYYTYIQLASIPIISLCTWLGFKKWGYNYIENIIINSFAVAQSLLLGILITPIKNLCIGTSGFFIITTVLSLFTIAFQIWLYLQLYKSRDLGFLILRMVLSGIIFVVLFLLAIVLGVVIGFSVGILKP
ncbi:DUF3667 domain-containing protein [Flavobacterium sp.]|uniref:DUF3667 domain-containing protein n=1 Tax=Flavobacterium sp. TaxID=239 RepID=UPI00262C32AD|nr:DUF3667 domain-containing protein [Flavobacterium sp.]